MSARLLFLIAFMFIQTGCAGLSTGRSFLADMDPDTEDTNFFNPSDDFPVVAGDFERRQRSPSSESDLTEDRANRALRAELRQLESMQTEESSEFYETHKEKLTSTSQRIYFLKLPPRERKDYLVARGIITEPKRTITAYERMSSKRSNDVLLGMNKHDVLASLGRPMRVEVAGNPRNENERWLYRMNGASKYIYFESGRVGGWE